MALAGGEVDQAALPEKVRPSPVGEPILFYLGPRGAVADRHSLKVGLRDLDIEVARIGEQTAVLEDPEMLRPDDARVPGDRDDEVGLPSRVQHRHHAEAVQTGLDGAHRVDLGDDHISPQSAETSGDSLSAPAVAGDH